MNRRDAHRMAAAGLASMLTLPVARAQSGPLAGLDHAVLSQRAPVKAPAGRFEVVDFFWYSCPHCNAFKSTVEAWRQRQSADVSVRRVPVAFNPAYASQQRLYYSLEALGVADSLHHAVFNAIHIGRQRLDRDDAVIAWAAGQPGVDVARFTETFRSFHVATQVQQANQLVQAYALDGVPALGVGGRFLVNGASAGDMTRALVVVDRLVADLRARS